MTSRQKAQLFRAQLALLELYPDVAFGEREGLQVRFWVDGKKDEDPGVIRLKNTSVSFADALKKDA